MPRRIELKYPNAGVDGGSGYEFQKNCLLYVLLSKFPMWKERTYHVFMEHYEDIVLCFLENDKLVEVYTYQVKKHQGHWTFSEIVPEVLWKMCNSGAALRQDDTYQKSDDYNQVLSFISNQDVCLKSETIGIANEEEYLRDFPSDIKKACIDSLLDNLREVVFSNKQELGQIDGDLKYDDWYSSLCGDEKNTFAEEVQQDPIYQEFNNVRFVRVDMPGGDKQQEQMLSGLLMEVCGGNLPYPNVALMVLLKKITDSATTYNQAEKITFDNYKKRITSDEINECIGLLTTKARAISEWRERIESYASSLDIPIRMRAEFQTEIENSFEYLKDKTKIEHQTILDLSRQEYLMTQLTNRDDFVKDIYKKYTEQTTSRLSSNTIKAICYAASFELF